MSKNKRALAPVAALTLATLLAAGCQRGDTNNPTAPNANNTAPISTATTATLKNLVTPQTAGHPVLEVKLGDAVTFQKDGVTLVFVPKSLTKVDGTPSDLSKNFDKSEDCGAWWQLDEEIVVDTQPNSSWKLWSTAFGAFIALQKGTMGDTYDHLPVGTSQAGDTSHPNAVQAISLANAEQQKNLSAPYHKTITSKQYFGACTDIRSQQPSGLAPLGVQLSLQGVRDGETSTTIARWLL